MHVYNDINYFLYVREGTTAAKTNVFLQYKAKLRKYFGSKNRKNCVKYGTGEEVELFLPSCQLYDYILP